MTAVTGRVYRDHVFITAVAVLGTAAFVAFSRSWESPVKVLYDVPAGLVVFAFVGLALRDVVFPTRGIPRWVRPLMLIPLAIVPVGRVVWGWPISGHATDVIAIATFEALSRGAHWAWRAAVVLPAPVVLAVRWFYLDRGNHSPSFLGLALGLFFAFVALWYKSTFVSSQETMEDHASKDTSGSQRK